MQTKILICIELTLITIILFGGIEAKNIRGGASKEGRTDGGGNVGAGLDRYK